MSEGNPMLERVQRRRQELRALLHQVRWLRRVVFTLAMLDVVVGAAVVWFAHREYFGG
ncbi:MAG: hypothetical protein AAGF11_29585 [Myxococcota bacterium]